MWTHRKYSTPAHLCAGFLTKFFFSFVSPFILTLIEPAVSCQHSHIVSPTTFYSRKPILYFPVHVKRCPLIIITPAHTHFQPSLHLTPTADPTTCTHPPCFQFPMYNMLGFSHIPHCLSIINHLEVLEPLCTQPYQWWLNNGSCLH